jgi:GT2 family glycosyltransferase
MTPHANIVFCTPGHSMMTSYIKSFLATITELGKRNISWAWSSEYSSHVADARETTLSGTTQNIISETRPFHGSLTYDKLMWIDSDIAWNPEDVIKLYESDKDIISGAYLLASGEVVAYKELMRNAMSYDEVLALKETTQIAGAGFGFICIKSGIFEQMTRPWFQSVQITTESDGKDWTFPIMGEDLSWCHRATELGYSIWLDPSVKVQHHKMMKLTWEGPRP